MNRRALLIGGAAALVIILLWWFLLWSPRNAELSAARARTAAAEARSSELAIQIKRLEAAQRLEPMKRARLETLRSAIPDEPQVAQLILDVNEAANRSGIAFLSIAPGLPAGGNPPVMSVSLNITGGYFQILDFINRLDDMPRIIVIDTLSLTPSGPAKMNANIGGRTFLSVVTGAGASVTPSTVTPAPVAPPAATPPGGPPPTPPTTAAGAPPTTATGQ